MKSKLIYESNGQRTWALIFDLGDEVLGELNAFARANNLGGSHFTAIGALSDVTLAWFDWESKQYKPISMREQVEVLTLAGDIALKDGKPAVHAHIVVGRSDGTAHGGHLKEAHVRPTLELILEESPAHLQKRFDPVSGLALIAL
jgi:hypothetical protein